MDLSPLMKRLICSRHPNEIITQVCTFPECQAASILFCPKCQSTESGHMTQHKKYLTRVKDFLESQTYVVEPSFIDELFAKTQEVEEKLKKIEDEYKKEDSQIDKDFGALFAIFFKLTESGKTMLKSALREPFTKISERNIALRRSLEYLKTNKNDPTELKKNFSMFTKDNSEEQFRSLIVKRHQKYETISTNLTDIILDFENCVKDKPTYKKSQYSQGVFEELKQSYEKTCQNVIQYIRNLVETAGAKPIPVKKIDLSSGMDKSSPLLEKQHNLSVAKIAQDIERSRSYMNKGPLAQSQFVSSVSRDLSQSSIDIDSLSPSKRYRSLSGFPEITNPKVLEVITRASPIRYPEDVKDDFIDFQTPITNYKCLELPDISVYQGQWRNNKKHGLGRIVYLDGGVYEGIWADDVPSGYGRVIRRNGDMYEGYVKEYKAHGQGSLSTLEGYRYNGNWVEDKKHGEGEEYIENSMFMYRGQFENNKYHGKGLLKLEDGRVFEGTFVDGKFSGQGIYFGPMSDDVQEQYEGEFVDWKKHGKGIFQLSDGSRYEGDFVNDVPEGYGEFNWPDGTISRGLWRNGKQDGIGEEIGPDGMKKEGEWVDGKWKRWLN